jgi:hypothetical protein
LGLVSMLFTGTCKVPASQRTRLADLRCVTEVRWACLLFFGYQLPQIVAFRVDPGFSLRESRHENACRSICRRVALWLSRDPLVVKPLSISQLFQIPIAMHCHDRFPGNKTPRAPSVVCPSVDARGL